ncbi:hypothetical protein FB45DRAFT_935466 [Roridomyces roridus]|uniref:Uncharacterized protein n=1 Tax=Roridomyces roridus TaxID=1738132 RepID=A0AAD7BAJ7_9AGAR|nr:hypothetical protein FB45DRAFT_935466 [Roridomyces roridus]
MILRGSPRTFVSNNPSISRCAFSASCLELDMMSKSSTHTVTQVRSSSRSRKYTQWSTAVLMSCRVVLVIELDNLNFEFVAAFRRDAEIKESKATQVATARADAEMKDATAPVREMVEEATSKALKKHEKEMERKMRNLLSQVTSNSTSSEASSSSKRPAHAKSDPKAAPQASSSKTKHERKPEATAFKRDAYHQRKTGKANEAGANRAHAAAGAAHGKGKGKKEARKGKPTRNQSTVSDSE